MRFRSISFWGPVISVVMIGAALRFLSTELSQVHGGQIWDAFKTLPNSLLVSAGFLAALNYLVLAGYEYYACLYAEVPQPMKRIAISSFIGNAFANTLGFSFLSGSSIKFRLYAAWGLSAADVGRIAIFTTVSLWLGLAGLGGLALVLSPETSELLALGSDVLGGALASLPCFYILASFWWREPLTILGFYIPAPGVKTACIQVAFSVLDWLLSGCILWVLLPGEWPAEIFFTRFMLAQLAGVLSQAPGGVGVFESAFLMLTPDSAEEGAIFAALLAFRAIYYIVPLILASLVLLIREVLFTAPVGRLLGHAVARWSVSLAPRILTAFTVVAGLLLLLSGATPALEWSLSWLTSFLPDVLVGGSHFVSSALGVCLLFLAKGLHQRVDVAYHLGLVVLALGIVASLLQGPDVLDAALLGVLLFGFWPNKARFTRHSSLLTDQFSPAWIAAIALVVAASAWLIFFFSSHGEYTGDFWVNFALQGRGSNVLRAAFGASVAGLCLAIIRLLAPAPYRPVPATAQDMDDARTVLATTRRTRPNLALLGDKHFLFSSNRDAFIMFAIVGRSWIALGEPVGEESEMPSLIWKFRELCDRHAGRPVFYGVPQERLHLFLNSGLRMLKLGEEALVDLPSFHLNGASRQGLRYKKNNLEKNGCSFEMIPPEDFAIIADELKTISDAWLVLKNTREKRFSLGCFDTEYLRHFHTAVVRRDGKILAFGNVWMSGDHSELSIDLMRFVSSSPRGVMDYLIFMLMFWGQQNGFTRFSLGVAPFSGLTDHRLAPVWNRVGNFLYNHAEDFYNFQGLRAYKEKFGPEWEPNYLLAPGGMALPGVLAEVCSLVAGGVKGMVGK